MGTLAFSNTHMILLVLLILSSGIQLPRGAANSFASSNAVGINYGRVADNLPTPSKAVELMKSINVGYVKIYDSDSQILAAIANTSLPVVITISNQEISGIASSSSTADQWVTSNVIPFVPATNISMIMVGNELLSDNGSRSVWTQLVPAMHNIHASLVNKNLDSAIKITTSVAMDALASSYPPSKGSFRADIASSVLRPMLSFLNATNSYFFLDVYPFFAWSSNPTNISLDYALFGVTTTASATKDGSLEYTNMLDAQLDATVTAMAERGYGNVKIAISETGWPTKGDADQTGATVANAARYNQRLVAKLLSNAGTPRRPHVSIPTFIFALFNEDDKPGATTERNWGVFQPDGTPIYAIDLSRGSKESDNGQGVVKTTTAKGAAAPSPSWSSWVGEWCVTNTALQWEENESVAKAALDYACNAGADCSAIEVGGACYEPNNVVSHASYAFNSYWQNTKSSGATCDFNGAATLTTVDPSFQGCSFVLKSGK